MQYHSKVSKAALYRPMYVALMMTFAAGIAVLSSGTAAQARDYKYCLVSPGYDFPGDCSYSTYQQCKASASGRLADCYVNPRAVSRRSRHY